MSWRAAAWLFALALAGLGFWWLDNWIASQAWASYQENEWHMTAKGWRVLQFVWPVALAGIIPGAVLAWYFLDDAASKTAAADYAERQRGIEAERQRLQASAQRLDEQRRELHQEHAAKMGEAQRRIETARAAQERAQQEIAAAQVKATKAEKHAASADRRRQNATAAAGRMRRKLNM